MLKRFTQRHRRAVSEPVAPVYTVDHQGEELDGSLTVDVLYGENLQNTDWLKNSDPYCVVQAAGRAFPTAVRAREGSNPKWYQSIGPFDIYPTTKKARFEIRDKDWFKKNDDLVGWAEVSLDEVRRQSRVQLALPVFTAKFKSHGRLHVVLTYSPASEGLLKFETSMDIESVPSSSLISDDGLLNESRSGPTREESASLPHCRRMSGNVLDDWNADDVMLRDFRNLRTELEYLNRVELPRQISSVREQQDKLLLCPEVAGTNKAEELQQQLNMQLKELLSRHRVVQYGVVELHGAECLIRDKGLVDPEIVSPLQIFFMQAVLENMGSVTDVSCNPASVVAKVQQVMSLHQDELDAAAGLSKLQVWSHILELLQLELGRAGSVRGLEGFLPRRSWSDPVDLYQSTSGSLSPGPQPAWSPNVRLITTPSPPPTAGYVAPAYTRTLASPSAHIQNAGHPTLVSPTAGHPTLASPSMYSPTGDHLSTCNASSQVTDLRRLIQEVLDSRPASQKLLSDTSASAASSLCQGSRDGSTHTRSSPTDDGVAARNILHGTGVGISSCVGSIGGRIRQDLVSKWGAEQVQVSESSLFSVAQADGHMHFEVVPIAEEEDWCDETSNAAASASSLSLHHSAPGPSPVIAALPPPFSEAQAVGGIPFSAHAPASVAIYSSAPGSQPVFPVKQKSSESSPFLAAQADGHMPFEVVPIAEEEDWDNEVSNAAASASSLSLHPSAPGPDDAPVIAPPFSVAQGMGGVPFSAHAPASVAFYPSGSIPVFPVKQQSSESSPFSAAQADGHMPFEVVPIAEEEDWGPMPSTAAAASSLSHKSQPIEALRTPARQAAEVFSYFTAAQAGKKNPFNPHLPGAVTQQQPEPKFSAFSAEQVGVRHPFTTGGPATAELQMDAVFSLSGAAQAGGRNLVDYGGISVGGNRGGVDRGYGDSIGGRGSQGDDGGGNRGENGDRATHDGSDNSGARSGCSVEKALRPITTRPIEVTDSDESDGSVEDTAASESPVASKEHYDLVGIEGNAVSQGSTGSMMSPFKSAQAEGRMPFEVAADTTAVGPGGGEIDERYERDEPSLSVDSRFEQQVVLDDYSFTAGCPPAETDPSVGAAVETAVLSPFKSIQAAGKVPFELTTGPMATCNVGPNVMPNVGSNVLPNVGPHVIPLVAQLATPCPTSAAALKVAVVGSPGLDRMYEQEVSMCRTSASVSSGSDTSAGCTFADHAGMPTEPAGTSAENAKTSTEHTGTSRMYKQQVDIFEVAEVYTNIGVHSDASHHDSHHVAAMAGQVAFDALQCHSRDMLAHGETAHEVAATVDGDIPMLSPYKSIQEDSRTPFEVGADSMTVGAGGIERHDGDERDARDEVVVVREEDLGCLDIKYEKQVSLLEYDAAKSDRGASSRGASMTGSSGGPLEGGSSNPAAAVLSPFTSAQMDGEVPFGVMGMEGQDVAGLSSFKSVEMDGHKPFGEDGKAGVSAGDVAVLSPLKSVQADGIMPFEVVGVAGREEAEAVVLAVGKVHEQEVESSEIAPKCSETAPSLDAFLSPFLSAQADGKVPFEVVDARHEYVGDYKEDVCDHTEAGRNGTGEEAVATGKGTEVYFSQQTAPVAGAAAVLGSTSDPRTVSGGKREGGHRGTREETHQVARGGNRVGGKRGKRVDTWEVAREPEPKGVLSPFESGQTAASIAVEGMPTQQLSSCLLVDKELHCSTLVAPSILGPLSLYDTPLVSAASGVVPLAEISTASSGMLSSEATNIADTTDSGVGGAPSTCISSSRASERAWQAGNASQGVREKAAAKEMVGGRGAAAEDDGLFSRFSAAQADDLMPLEVVAIAEEDWGPVPTNAAPSLSVSRKPPPIEVDPQPEQQQVIVSPFSAVLAGGRNPFVVSTSDDATKQPVHSLFSAAHHSSSMASSEIMPILKEEETLFCLHHDQPPASTSHSSQTDAYSAQDTCASGSKQRRQGTYLKDVHLRDTHPAQAADSTQDESEGMYAAQDEREAAPPDAADAYVSPFIVVQAGGPMLFHTSSLPHPETLQHLVSPSSDPSRTGSQLLQPPPSDPDRSGPHAHPLLPSPQSTHPTTLTPTYPLTPNNAPATAFQLYLPGKYIPAPVHITPP